MANDYIPSRQGDLDTFYENLLNKLPDHALALGIPQEDIDALVAKIEAARQAYIEKETAKSEYASKVEEYRAVNSDTESSVRNMANRIKSAPAYTKAIGDELNFIGEESEFDPDTAKPTVQLKIVSGNNVEIKFNNPREVQGVWIYSRPADTTPWVKISVDTSSPYLDSRDNTNPGQPETREYRAIFFDDDAAIGQYSDIVSITVPA